MRHTHSAKWHRDIQNSAENFTPLNFNPLNAGPVAMLYFPLEALQAHTNLYLQKRGSLNSDERDSCLTELVRNHPVKDIAITACAHAMSTSAVITVLDQEFPVDGATGWGAMEYLRAITGVYYARWEAISKNDAQLAQNLILLTPCDPSVGQYLYVYFLAWSQGEVSSLLQRPFVRQILGKACHSFVIRLETLGAEGLWKRAYDESAWLSRLLNSNPGTKQLLDAVFPSWKIWAHWMPDINRLRRWESLDNLQRKQLVDILALEGPDFCTGERSILLEGVSPCDPNKPCSRVYVGQLDVRLKDGNGAMARAMLVKLLTILDTACSKSPGILMLFTHISLSKPVDTEALRFLDLVNDIRSPSIGTDMLRALTAKDNTVRAAATIQLVSSLNDDNGEGLRGVFTPFIMNSLGEDIVRLQNSLCERLQKGREAPEIATKLYAIGKGLKAATWLENALNDKIKAWLQNLLTERDLKSLLELRHDIDVRHASQKSKARIPAMIDAYCMSFLADRGAIDEEAKETVEELVRFWQQYSDRECRAVAIALAERTAISAGLRRQCLAQLNNMSKDFVREVSIMVKKDTDMTCINFARVLAAENSSGNRDVECWCRVLLSMMEQQDETLVEYALSHLNLQSWLEWMSDLRTLFRSLDLPNPRPIIFQHALHPWTEKLSTRYRRVLLMMEEEAGSLAGLRRILLGGEYSRSLASALEAREMTPEYYG